MVLVLLYIHRTGVLTAMGIANLDMMLNNWPSSRLLSTAVTVLVSPVKSANVAQNGKSASITAQSNPGILARGYKSRDCQRIVVAVRSSWQGQDAKYDPFRHRTPASWDLRLVSSRSPCYSMTVFAESIHIIVML